MLIIRYPQVVAYELLAITILLTRCYFQIQKQVRFNCKSAAEQFINYVTLFQHFLPLPPFLSQSVTLPPHNYVTPVQPPPSGEAWFP